MSFFTAIILCCTFLAVGTVQARADMSAATRYFEKKDYPAAVREIKPLAESGNVDAQYNLGVMYDRGLGVSRNITEAVNWYRSSQRTYRCQSGPR